MIGNPYAYIIHDIYFCIYRFIPSGKLSIAGDSHKGYAILSP